MNNDPLAPVLAHFNARANLFFSGNLCGHVKFSESNGVGYLHLLRSGSTRLHDQTGYATVLDQPTLVFYSRPLTHWFDADPRTGADLVCASVAFPNAAHNPIVRALPSRFSCLLAELSTAQTAVNALFAEAFADRPGRQEILNRLFEVVLIELLRTAMTRGDDAVGFLRGMMHPQVGKALAAIHADAAREWTLELLADVAGMSRSSFASVFKREVGETPGDYLLRWRVSIAQTMIRTGTPLKLVAERVGYASQAGFLRAFKLALGISPAQWRRALAKPTRSAPKLD